MEVNSKMITPWRRLTLGHCVRRRDFVSWFVGRQEVGNPAILCDEPRTGIVQLVGPRIRRFSEAQHVHRVLDPKCAGKLAIE
jgi:hypothetical protein